MSEPSPPLATDEQARKDFTEAMPTYQRYQSMALVRQAARLLRRESEQVIYRDAFRWHDDSDESVMSNHYECQNLPYLAEEFSFEVIHDFHHVAVIRRKA